MARALLKLLKHQLQKHQHLKQKQVLSLWVELWRARLQILMVIVEAAAAAAAVRPVTSGRAVFLTWQAAQQLLTVLSGASYAKASSCHSRDEIPATQQRLAKLQQRVHCEARHTIQACFHHPSEALVKATVFLNS